MVSLRGLIGNALNNGKESGSSRGITRSAIADGIIVLTDEAKQLALTGKTADETVASLNRDIANAQNAAQKLDVEAMKQSAEAKQQIKQALFAEAIKFTDESYREIFLKEHPLVEIMRDAEGKIILDKEGKPVVRILSEQEKSNLQPGPDGKIHIAANGIFNDMDAAGKYAAQHGATAEGPLYLVYFPEAESAVSELLVAAYQKFLENDFWGLSNSAEQIKDAMNQYGQEGLQLDGHSRGSMTIGNALESLAANSDSAGSLSGTNIHFFGPAYNAAKADDLLSYLQNRDAMSIADQQKMILEMQNHFADPVGTLIGGNPGTGGTIPIGSNILIETIRALGGENTVHNCYNSASKACQQFWK